MRRRTPIIRLTERSLYPGLLDVFKEVGERYGVKVSGGQELSVEGKLFPDLVVKVGSSYICVQVKVGGKSAAKELEGDLEKTLAEAGKCRADLVVGMVLPQRVRAVSFEGLRSKVRELNVAKAVICEGRAKSGIGECERLEGLTVGRLVEHMMERLTRGFPNPNYYLGVFSGSDPTPSLDGQWWYRADANQVLQYVDGRVVSVTPLGSATVVYGSQTLGGLGVYVGHDVVVLPSSTLVTYGSVTFAGNLFVLPGAVWLSSNPAASPTSPAANFYAISGTLYLDGDYVVGEYNFDEHKISPGSFTCLYRAGSIKTYGTDIGSALTLADAIRASGCPVSLVVGKNPGLSFTLAW